MSDVTKDAMGRELEAKRRKLEELKRLRAQRMQQQQQLSMGAPPADVQTPATGATAAARSPTKQQSAEDILNSVNSLLPPSPAVAPSATPSPPPAAGAALSPSSSSSRPIPSLSASATHHIDILPAEAKILYEQATQTETRRRAVKTEGETEGEPAADAKGASVWDRMAEDERDEIIHERDELRIREMELLQQVRELRQARDKAAEQAESQREAALHATLPPEEAEKVLSSSEFVSFLDRSSKAVERLLGFEEHGGAAGFDYMADYSADDDALTQTGGGEAQLLTHALAFTHDASGAGVSGATSNIAPQANSTLNRPITSINWSQKYPELLLASYASVHNRMEETVHMDNAWLEPDGSVLVWNLHMSKRPEYSFSCQSGIHTALFHPAHPKLIVGGCENGQLVIWDMRTSKSTPVNRSSLSHGHTHPVFSIAIQPLASGLFHIVSASSDGQVCIWNENNLHRPLHDIQLVNLRGGMGMGMGGLLSGASDVVSSGLSSRDDLTTTCFDLPARDTQTIVLGSDEGRIYKARLHEAKDSERIYEQIHAHDAPMTHIEFHPSSKLVGSSNLAGSGVGGAAGSSATPDLFLTSSYDWTVKLWSTKLSKPLYVFEGARDYVYSAAWCPSNPYVFASADGTGKLDVWSLGQDNAGDESEVPLVSVQVGAQDDGNAANNTLASPTASASATPSTTLSDNSDPTAQAPGRTHAVSKIRWNDAGNMIACGTSTGALHIYNVSADIYTPTREATDRWFEKISNRLGGQNTR